MFDKTGTLTYGLPTVVTVVHLLPDNEKNPDVRVLSLCFPSAFLVLSLCFLSTYPRTA